MGTLQLELELSKKVEFISTKVKRTDIVFEVYKNESRKRETQEKRGKGKDVTISVKKNTPIFRKTNELMTIDLFII